MTEEAEMGDMLLFREALENAAHDQAWDLAIQATPPMWLGPRLEPRWPNRWRAWIDEVLGDRSTIDGWGETETAALTDLVRAIGKRRESGMLRMSEPTALPVPPEKDAADLLVEHLEHGCKNRECDTMRGLIEAVQQQERELSRRLVADRVAYLRRNGMALLPSDIVGVLEDPA